jgi:hypothetical protein
LDVLIFQTWHGGHDPPETPPWAGTLLSLLDNLLTEIRKMSATLDSLADRVTQIETVGDSAIALLNGLKEALDAAIAGGDMAAVAELSARLSAQTDELAEAVAKNTLAENESDA